MFLTPTLTVDLAAITANWRLLRACFTGAECAAVVKADAYGLGMIPVASALANTGCDTFFVATLEEGLALRAALGDVRILVFHGVGKGEEFAFANHRLIPVLNSPEQLERWLPVAAEHIHAVSALHVDTGMGRLGFEHGELARLLAKHADAMKAARVGLIMSHLACAPEPAHESNMHQLARLKEALKLTPGIPVSFVNSGGIFLPADYHFHLARPGCSLYGIAPQALTLPPLAGGAGGGNLAAGAGGEASKVPPLTSPPLAGGIGVVRQESGTTQNPMQQVAQWQAPILQVRTLEAEQAVGYGATQILPKGARLVTVASGYADGYLRALSNRAVAYLGAHRLPIAGRVTMDMLCFDASDVPLETLREGEMITLLGKQPEITVDALADAAGTIGYEIFTRIGARVKRTYTGV
jgi:alanine racemase